MANEPEYSETKKKIKKKQRGLEKERTRRDQWYDKAEARAVELGSAYDTAEPFNLERRKSGRKSKGRTRRDDNTAAQGSETESVPSGSKAGEGGTAPG